MYQVFGVILLGVAGALFWVDRRFGLSYLVAGLGASLAFVGAGMVLGIDLDYIDPFAVLFAAAVFTPIAVRLYFVREMRRGPTAAGEQSSAETEDPRDRNADFVLQHAPRVASHVKRFTFFFVQGTLLVLVANGVFGQDDLSAAHFVGIPASAAYQATAIAERYTASPLWQGLWGAVGLFLVGPLILFFIIAHRLHWQIAWLIGG